ncbi:MAG TPA: hypothetical protein VF008_13405 [Niastella sp.]
MAQLSYSQKDSSITDMETWDKEYLEEIYNPQTKSVNNSYNYSNKWDVDGDHKNDALFFIGNGGAHAYYFLRVQLSSDHVVRDFTSIQLDMPYFQDPQILDENGKSPAIQFVVKDFDKDGVLDLYLNFNNPFGSISKTFRQKGITSKYIILGFAGGKMKVSAY